MAAFYETTIQLGSRDNATNDQAVTQLQMYLQSIAERDNRPDFNPGNIDGVFGAKTQLALKNFQNALGLTANGICNYDVWAALDAVLGAQGSIAFYTQPYGYTQPLPLSGNAPATQPDNTTIPVTQQLGGVEWKTVGIVAAVVLGLMFLTPAKGR